MGEVELSVVGDYRLREIKVILILLPKILK